MKQPDRLCEWIQTREEVTKKTYAHLALHAWEQDYHRVSFVVPDADAAYGESKNVTVLAREAATQRLRAV